MITAAIAVWLLRKVTALEPSAAVAPPMGSRWSTLSWRDQIAEAFVHAVYPSRRGLVPAVRVFLDFLGEHVGDNV